MARLGRTMRTTVKLDEDVAAAVQRLRRERGIGLSEAVNDLVRRGLARSPERHPFRQQTAPIELRIDVTDVAEALDRIEGSARR